MNKLTLVKNKNKMFFTSDLHFGHRNVLKFCNRPYENVKEMNEDLINRWNGVVTGEDTVFVLGDIFWFNDRKDMKKIFSRLKGKYIYLILGNHDAPGSYTQLLEEGVIGDRIRWVDDVFTLHLNDSDGQEIKEIVCSHYPLLTWSHRDRGAINLFGHIHSGPVSTCTFDTDLPFWKGQHYDVGVDNNNYTPIEIDQILVKLNQQKPKGKTGKDIVEELNKGLNEKINNYIKEQNKYENI